MDRLTILANSTTGSFGFSYDALSRRTQMTRPNGISTNYTYDSLSHLLSVLHQSGTSTVDGTAYTLDSAGNRTAKTDDYAGVTSNYAYDAIYQLLSATEGGSTTERYTYDPVGNRLSSLGVSPYQYNSSNELTQTPNALFAQDANGNTTLKTDSTGSTTYVWDYENRLTSVTLPNNGGTVQFRYDPFGRRIEKISPNATSIFAYDGDNLVETVNSGGGVVARYTQGQDIDEQLAMQRGSTTSYYEQDGLGSVTSLSNAAGVLVQTYTYDSFGNTTNSSGSVTNFFRYTGREFDTETGFYFLRARYYDPQTGRFISEDPIGFSGDSTGFYAYADNSPIGLADASGLQANPKPSPEPVNPDPAPPSGPVLVPPPVPEPGPVTMPPICVEFPEVCALGGILAFPQPTGVDPVPPPEQAPVPPAGPNFQPTKKPGRCQNQSGCQPCVPPVGTLAYEEHSGPGRSGKGVSHWPFTGPHWHLFEMHQSPAPSCNCFWVEIGQGQGPAPWPIRVGPSGGGPQ